MGRRIAIIILTIFAFIGGFSSCSSDLINEVQEQIVDDRIAAGEIDAYQIKFSSNGTFIGDLPVDENLYIEGEEVIIPDDIAGMLKNGYSFAGWNTMSDGSGTTYPLGGKIIIGTEDVLLYPLWEPNLYTVHFIANTPNAVGEMADQEIACDASESLFECSFTVDGWTFLGWAVSENGPVLYGDTDFYTMGASDISLYAQWVDGLAVIFHKDDDLANRRHGYADYRKGGVCSS